MTEKIIMALIFVGGFIILMAFALILQAIKLRYEYLTSEAIRDTIELAKECQGIEVEYVEEGDEE